MRKLLFILVIGAISIFSFYAQPTTMLPDTQARIKSFEVVKITYPTPPKWFSHKLTLYIMRECDRSHIPYLLVFKLIERESEWYTRARHYNRDAEGHIISVDYNLMQINSLNINFFVEKYKDPDRSIKSYDVRFDAYDNVQIGIRHLADLYNRLHSWPKAIAAYNTGYTNVKNNDICKETLQYIAYVCPVNYWWTFPVNVRIERNGIHYD